MEPYGLMMEEGNDELLPAVNDHHLEFEDNMAFILGDEEIALEMWEGAGPDFWGDDDFPDMSF